MERIGLEGFRASTGLGDKIKRFFLDGSFSGAGPEKKHSSTELQNPVYCFWDDSEG